MPFVAPTSSSASIGWTWRAPSRPSAMSPPRSFRYPSIIGCTMAGAWTTRACLRSTYSSTASRTSPCRPCSQRLASPSPRISATRAKEFPAPAGDKLTVDHLAVALRKAVGERPTSLTHVSLSWNGANWAFRSSPRLSRLRRRRRCRWRPRHFSRSCAGAQRQRPAADRRLRRWRLPDGHHRALDRGALPHSFVGCGRQ